MKTITLVRHAKSEWENANLISDADRPLNLRGVKNAYAMSVQFNEEHCKPDVIITSHAARALHTAIIFAQNIHFDMLKMQIKTALYHAEAKQILNTMQQIDETDQHVMIFAHNPGIEDFLQFVTNKYIEVPTCAVLQFTSNSLNWADLDYHKLNFKQIEIPKK